MKTILPTLVVLAIVAVASSASAQISPEQNVKILPSSQPGVIKLHYPLPVDEPLHVTFYNDERKIIGRDKISGLKAPNGISKRYDVNKIRKDEYWIEIRSRKHLVVYHVTPDIDGKKFIATLEPASSQLLVKANN